MQQSFEQKSLGSVLDFLNGKSIKPGGSGIYPVYGSNGIIGRSDDHLFENAVIIGRVGAYCGSIAYCPTKFWASDNTIVAVPKDSTGDVRFYAYLLKHLELNNYAGGAAQPLVTQGVLKRVDALIPNAQLQKRMSAILAAYDDLIENNTRRIQILEEMARRIYEEWFVRFRFPGHENVRMVESELGLIPERWEVKTLSLLIRRLTAGNTYRDRDISSEGDVIVVDQSNSEYLGFHNNQPDHQANPEHPVIVFGDHTCKLQIMITPFSIGANTVPFVGNNETPVYYLYNLIKGLVTTKEYKRHWTELNNKTVIEAAPKLCAQYDELVRPFFEAMDVLRSKNRKLRRARDLLLPKLISGEIDVSNFPEPE